MLKVKESNHAYTKNLLDLKNSYVFKKVFRKETNRDLLLDFLNSFLRQNIVEIIQVKDSKHLGHEFFEEFSIDVKTDKEELFNIELHLVQSDEYQEQIMIKWMKEYVREVQLGYTGNIPRIVMYLFDFNKVLSTRHKVQKALTLDGNFYSNHYEIHAIHMVNYIEEENESNKRKWLDFLIGDYQVKQALATDKPFFEKALKSLIQLNLDEVFVSEANEFLTSLKEVYYYRYRNMDINKWNIELDRIHYLVTASSPMSYQEIATHFELPLIEVIAKSKMYSFFY
ncbi:PD-(D/E)XK nuclease family transposase [Bacillus sp. FJAT-22090]|uniref:PD-(D/E)XK nuclease family transposase n=1 Tax=Bacillus sp. FJAT-22090 TaxID=1581038 RepID=UPI00119E25BC|nr:PD-(D/E)XK nuclease family transposase [Bacillus sp. FJAT-22090]